VLKKSGGNRLKEMERGVGKCCAIIFVAKFIFSNETFSFIARTHSLAESARWENTVVVCSAEFRSI